MEGLKHIKKALVSCVENQLGNLAQADGKELGEAIDMIKDIEESMYYCAITKAMEEQEKKGKKEEEEEKHYYRRGGGRRSMMMPYPMAEEMRPYDRYSYYEPDRDVDKDIGKMYYSGGGSSSSGQGGSGGGNNARGGGGRGYEEMEYFPYDMRDDREGRSPTTRRSYIEGKEMHVAKEKQLKELEKYMQELTVDMTEMIRGASPEEKQLLQKKITTLAEKVGQVSV